MMMQNVGIFGTMYLLCSLILLQLVLVFYYNLIHSKVLLHYDLASFFPNIFILQIASSTVLSIFPLFVGPAIISSNMSLNTTLNILSNITTTDLSPTSGDLDQDISDLSNIIHACIAFLMTILICFGNGLVIVSIYAYESLQTTTNVFILFLALADILVGKIFKLHIMDHKWSSS